MVLSVKPKDKKQYAPSIKENDIMGKARDLFKKTRAIKGTFHARMGTIKDRKRGLKMAEKSVDVEYISLHGYIRNTP